ncbi:MAG: group III truncated hemoglobin [Pseudomonadales bacterium]
MLKRSDLQSRDDIERFVSAFYQQLLNDPKLAPIFVDVAKIDLNQHKPLIIAYWEKLLLGGTAYKRHTMNIHRAVHSKRPLHDHDFQRWLAFFTQTMDELYAGPLADRAKSIAATIASNMQASL